MIGECEMTGKRNAELFQVKIEGSLMNVCKECVKFGEQIDKPKSFKNFRPQFSFRKDENENKFVVKDYALRIKKSRESKNLKQVDMANKLNEKESLLHNIESGHMKLSFPLAKKLEKFLGITLFETVKETPTNSFQSSKGKNEPLTMEAAFLKAMKKKK